MELRDLYSKDREEMVIRLLKKRQLEETAREWIKEQREYLLSEENKEDFIEEYFDSLDNSGILYESKEYTKYIKGHVKNLKTVYRWLKKYLPEIFPKGFFNKENRDIRKAIRNHDKSKWSKGEYKAYDIYDDYRHGRKSKDNPEFEKVKKDFDTAWNHHQKSNPHHWQYWIIIKGDGSQKVLDMPYENIIEMICDWWTFSWKENNLHSIFEWYSKNKNNMILSTSTRNTVESILHKMKNRILELEKQDLKESTMNFKKLSEAKYWTCSKCGANLDFNDADGYGPICNDCKRSERENTKNESVAVSIVRESRLPKDNRDPEYGIPEQKKYPLFDREHVESAIRLFGHVDPRFEEKLARAIIAKMRKYGMSYKMIGKDNRLYNYIPEKMMNESEEVGYVIKQEFPVELPKEIKHDLASTEILNNLRADIQDELAAIKNYDTHADAAEQNNLEDIAKVLRDIRDEEKVHIGELQAVLSKYDETYAASVAEGEDEVETELLESVLDPVQKTRCMDIFTEDNKVKPEVKEFIISTFEKFLSELEDVNLKIKQYLLIGSSTSYQYTDTSDVDVTVLVEEYPDEIRKKIVPLLPNGNNLPGTQRPVNYFIREEMDNRLAENIYDLTNDTWIKEMPRENVEVPQSYILEIAKFFMNAVDLTVSEFERDRQAYLEYKDLDPERVEISPEERLDVMSAKMAELKADLDSIRIGNHMIRGFLHDAYDSEENYFKVNIEIGNPYGTPHRSVNNLVYKCLEKYGYREKIDNFIKDAKAFIEKETESKD